MMQETDSFGSVGNRNAEKRNEDDILERGETTPILHRSEKTIDLGKRIIKYQQAAGAGRLP